MKMSRKKAETYDFSKEYKALPVKKRVRLITIAKILLKLQRESWRFMAYGSCCFNNCSCL
jgi:hypothetical protein